MKDTGTAKYPGDDDRRPAPPYIFRARPVGSHGPYNLRLLIQPGSRAISSSVVDITKAHISPQPGRRTGHRRSQPPDVAQPPARRRRSYPSPDHRRSASRSQAAAAAAAAQPPHSSASSGTAALRAHRRYAVRPDHGSGATAPTPSDPQPSLAPPPDPAPPTQ